jgi:hypothetical protein
MDGTIKDLSVTSMKAGVSSPPREKEQEKQIVENQFISSDQFKSWTRSFEENILGILNNLDIKRVPVDSASNPPVEYKDSSKAVRMQEPIKTPDAEQARPSRPSDPQSFYIAPTIDFDRRTRVRDRRMDSSERYHYDLESAPLQIDIDDEVQFRRQLESKYDDKNYDREEELHSFRRARDARDADDLYARSGTVRKKPRESIIKRAIKSVDNSTVSIQITKVQPPFDHIMLRKLAVQQFAKWSDQIVEYTNINKISLPIPTMVDPEIRNFLISQESSLTRANWTRLTAEEVFSLIAGHLRPKTKLEFYNSLSDNVKFEYKRKSIPNSANYSAFYDALLLYQTDFTLIFDILAERNEHNIPQISNKKGGLIKLFIEKISIGDYAENVLKTLGTDKFDDMLDFIDRFFAVVKGHYKDSLRAAGLNEVFGGTSYLEQAVEQPKKSYSSYSSNASKDGAAYKPSYSSKSWSSTPRSSTSSRPVHRVSHMMENVEDASDDELVVERRVLVDSIFAAAREKSGYDSIEDADTVRQEDEDGYHSSPGPHDKADFARDQQAIDIETQLQNVNDSELAMIQAATAHSRAGFGRPSPSSVPSSKSSHSITTKNVSGLNGCYTLLLHGECKRPDCRYSHDSGVLSKTWIQCSKLLAASKFKPRDTDRRVSTLSHMVMGQPEGDMASMNHFEDDIFDPKLAELRHNMFLAAMPEASLHSAMHREGEILLPDGDPLPVFKVLFDTGALHSSYISTQFVEKYSAFLAPFIHECDLVVRLADHKTCVKIDRVARLRVNFIGDDMVEHSAEINFCVFETSGNNMIIGLPAIVRSFGVLFRQMLDAVMDDFSSSTAAAISTTQAGEEDSVPIVANIAKNIDSDVTYPWSTAVEGEAPEDLATDPPCSFKAALHFMEMPHEELVKEYCNMFDSHVSLDFLEACPQLLKLLKTKGMKVFVPSKWEGITGIDPLELVWKETMVNSLKPAARFVNPKLYSTAEAEFDRLKKYLLRPSTSPIASPLVIAPKATKPFIRICGDYVAINKYINIGHYPIPNVPYSLEKICHYRVFVDLDMTNSFHQFRLAALTSSRLSWQTPWGQYEPIFMPEGIGPASGVLQKAVSEIFSDFGEWMICIFDNLLILAMDFNDAFKKLELVLDRCIERNVCLKFSKSWLGFDHANFFGYVCRYQRYELSESRKEALSTIPFPTTLKKMQSFLGAALFCKSFVPHYSTLTAPLSDMTKQSFSWNESTWTVDYRKIFDEFKVRLLAATSIFYPDYGLDWILRTDASLYGVGAMLLQVYRSSPDAEPQYQPIGFASQKFSPQAHNWSTIEQEAYGIYFSVKHFSYYLHCKQFILETDHNNLLWMEASAVPKIIR